MAKEKWNPTKRVPVKQSWNTCLSFRGLLYTYIYTYIWTGWRHGLKIVRLEPNWARISTYCIYTQYIVGYKITALLLHYCTSRIHVLFSLGCKKCTTPKCQNDPQKRSVSPKNTWKSSELNNTRRPLPNHPHFYRWYKLTIPSHGWFYDIVLPTVIQYSYTLWLCQSSYWKLPFKNCHL